MHEQYVTDPTGWGAVREHNGAPMVGYVRIVQVRVAGNDIWLWCGDLTRGIDGHNGGDTLHRFRGDNGGAPVFCNDGGFHSTHVFSLFHSSGLVFPAGSETVFPTAVAVRKIIIITTDGDMWCFHLHKKELGDTFPRGDSVRGGCHIGH